MMLPTSGNKKQAIEYEPSDDSARSDKDQISPYGRQCSSDYENKSIEVMDFEDYDRVVAETRLSGNEKSSLHIELRNSESLIKKPKEFMSVIQSS